MWSFGAPSYLAPVFGPDWVIVVAALVVVGVVMLALELVVIPGFGVIGLLGVGSMVGGAIIAWKHAGPMGGLAAMFGGAIGAGALFWIFSRTGLGKGMMLAADQKGFQAPDSSLSRLVGQVGITETVLRPAGSAVFGEERVDVVAEGVFVEQGKQVRVLRVEGVRVVVETVEELANR